MTILRNASCRASLNLAEHRAEIALAAQRAMPKKIKKVSKKGKSFGKKKRFQMPRELKEPLNLGEAISYMFLIDAIRTLKDDNEKLLMKPTKRRVEALEYQVGHQLDGAFIEWGKSKPKNEFKSLIPHLKKLAKIKCNNKSEAKQGFSKKIDALTNIIVKSKKHLRGILGPAAAASLLTYIESDQEEIDCATLCAKTHKLPVRTGVTFCAKSALKGLKQKDPDWFKEDFLSSHGALTDQDVMFAKRSAMKVKVKKGPITLETHPEYFTREKPFEQLTVPIPIDVNAVQYLKDIKKEINTDKYDIPIWYARFRDPQTNDWEYTYLVSVREGQGEKIWKGVKQLQKAAGTIRKKNLKIIQAKDKKQSVLALCVHLIDIGGFRVGNSKSEMDDVRGLHNLLVKHCKITKKGSIKFEYTQKKEIPEKVSIKTKPYIVDIVRGLMEGKKPDDHLFTVGGRKLTPELVNEYFQGTLGSPVSIHKLRHLNSTEMFIKGISGDIPITVGSPNSKKKKFFKDLVKTIGKRMGHTNTSTTLKSYLDPEVVKDFKNEFKIEASTLPMYDIDITGRFVIARASKKEEEIDEDYYLNPISITEDEDIHTLHEPEDVPMTFDSETINLAVKRLAAKAAVKEILSAARATIKTAYKKGDRVVIKIKDGTFIGTVKTNKVPTNELVVQLDNGEKVTLKVRGNKILGPGKRKKRKSAIPDLSINDFLTIPLTNEDAVKVAKKVKFPKKKLTDNDSKKAVDKIKKKTPKIPKPGKAKKSPKTPGVKTKVLKKGKILKVKKTSQDKEKSRQEKDVKKQERIAHKAAERLRKKQKKEDVAKRKQDEELKRKEKTRKQAEKEAEALRKLAEKEKRAQEKQSERDRKKQKRLAKEARIKEKARKQAEKEKKQKKKEKEAKTPKVKPVKERKPTVKTPGDASKDAKVRLTKKQKKALDKVKKSAQKKQPKQIMSLIDTLDDVCDLSKVPGLLKDNKAYLTAGNKTQQGKLNIKLQVAKPKEVEFDGEIELVYPKFTCTLTATYDVSNFIEVRYDPKNDNWQIVDDKSYGAGEVKVGRNGYITDARLAYALEGLIELAKMDAGFFDEEEDVLNILCDVLEPVQARIYKRKRNGVNEEYINCGGYTFDQIFPLLQDDGWKCDMGIATQDIYESTRVASATKGGTHLFLREKGAMLKSTLILVTDVAEAMVLHAIANVGLVTMREIKIVWECRRFAIT